MARKKLSEYRAKILLSEELGKDYAGISFDASRDDFSKLRELDQSKSYVIKIDEGIKKRMKKGLVVLNKRPTDLKEEIGKFSKLGYKHFIIEPFIQHDSSSEKYFSIERVRDGYQVLYSERGGIDIEENQSGVKKALITSEESFEEINSGIKLPRGILSKIVQAFDKYYFSFLEINPLVVENGSFHFLDIASTVDSAGQFFVKNAWDERNLRTGEIKAKTNEEKKIAELSAKSQASFAFDFLNPDGSIFVLLSGGGASVVLADEVYNLGFGRDLANYGDYSGNPNAEETYIYTRNILSLLLKSKAKKKVFVIAGGVANFTDIRITFKGVIKALSEYEKELKKQNVKIFVRRGGPHQEEGIIDMEKFLLKAGLGGVVSGPEMKLPEVVSVAISALK